MKPQEHEVIVVGAGPVGTVAAYRLARMGIDAIVLEAEDQCIEDLRASTIHPPTLEMFRELGIVDTLIERGLKAPVYQFRERRTGDFVAFDFTELADITDYPYRLQCEQYKITRLLAKKLEAEFSRPVLFSNRVVSVAQSPTRVTVEADTPNGRQSYGAKFLIAADGGGSIVRKTLDVPFVGKTYPEKFLTFSTDTRLEDYFENFARVNYVADAHEWASIILTPSGWRLLVPAPGDMDDEALVSDSYKDTVFAKLIGESEKVATHHRTVYRVNQRVAAKYNHGRIVLAGDAAHVHNPLGGFGMNSGIHDAWNLADKLGAIIRDRHRAEEQLGMYDRQRRTIMTEFVQAQTAQNKSYMEAASDSAHTEQRKRLEEIAAHPDLRRSYLLKQSMITSRQEERAIA